MTALASNALTTVANVKELLGIASSVTKYDNLITRKINSVSDQIEQYTHRVFLAADYVEVITASQIDTLVLKQRPINSVTSLEYRTTGLNIDDWISLSNNYFFYDATAGILKLDFAASGNWDRWRVTYNAGFAANAIPDDLQEAVATLAAYYTNNPIGNAYIQRKQEGGRAVMFHNTVKSFRVLLQELGIDDVLDSYSNYPILTV